MPSVRRSLRTLRIGFIIATTREGRFGTRPLPRHRRPHEATCTSSLDLRDYPMPFFNEPKSPLWPKPKNEVALRLGAEGSWDGRFHLRDGGIQPQCSRGFEEQPPAPVDRLPTRPEGTTTFRSVSGTSSVGAAVPQALAFIATIVSLQALLPLLVLTALVVRLAFRAKRAARRSIFNPVKMTECRHRVSGGDTLDAETGSQWRIASRPPEQRFHLSRPEEPRERGRRIFLPSHQVASCRVLWRRVDRRIRVRPPQCFGPNRSRCR